jgi:hypothetical protein
MVGTESKKSNRWISTFFILLILREVILNLQFLRSMKVSHAEIYDILGVYNDLLYGLKE